MNGGKRSAGYTIVEVLIVLAVSGMMFVIAAQFIGGKQGRTQFTQGSNELAARIQSIQEEVSDGQYSDIPFTCRVSGLTVSISGAPPPNHNPDCVFAGKLVHFSLGGTASKYEVFSLAGARSVGAVQPTIANSLIRPIDNPTPPDPINLTKLATIPQNLDITKMRVIDISGVAHAFYGVGFLQGLGVSEIVGASTYYKSGAQSLILVYASLANNLNNPSAVTKLNTPATGLAEAKSVEMCVSDHTRSAIVSLGTNNNQLSTTVRQLGEGGPDTCGL